MDPRWRPILQSLSIGMIPCVKGFSKLQKAKPLSKNSRWSFQGNRMILCELYNFCAHYHSLADVISNASAHWCKGQLFALLESKCHCWRLHLNVQFPAFSILELCKLYYLVLILKVIFNVKFTVKYPKKDTTTCVLIFFKTPNLNVILGSLGYHRLTLRCPSKL